MSAVVLRGDARALPLPDASVDLIVTSPPFFGLRDYRDAGESLAGQVGSEATPQEYIVALLECTREWVRVLKPSGSLFVELGDSYYSGKGAPGKTTIDAKSPARTMRRITRSPLDYGLDYPRKCLLDLPHRYAIRCVDDLGLIKRAEIIWHHVNGLPESVTDRVRRAHSVVFHFTLQPRYYAAVDEVREMATTDAHALSRRLRTDRRLAAANGGQTTAANPLGALPGSVWDIPSQPLTVPGWLGIDHFDAFPMELPRRIISGWSPPGICTACGQGRRPVVMADYNTQGRTTNGPKNDARHTAGALHMAASIRSVRTSTITGYTCACSARRDQSCDGYGYVAADAPAAAEDGVSAARTADRLPPTRPAVVLDPFCGTGTTMLVASALGRAGIGVDRSADYCRLARWRISDPGERAKAMQVPKPPPVPAGQVSLFDLDGAPS